ncbi:hypothetical protein KSP39_PZI012474 [Platanthera zijinensis]|uniref:DEK-C domain-containing protein n=1 Tax=Platanthera zijinensis TaxID=2320716 RepID=A0AAP0BFL8_9ASPA
MASEFPIEEVHKESSFDPSSPANPEVLPPEEEPTLGGDQAVLKKRGRKRRSEVKEGDREEVKKRAAPIASPLDRPSRERKSVQRFAAQSPPVISATKAVVIEQGSGEKLKDIPNVVFRLSKRKVDESLKVLHKVLFGRKANVHFLKRDILQFSGFVWSEDKEKKRSKIREKLNKCPKDRLLDFCNILDIYALKVATKKEDVLLKLLEFLESPHVTREVVLAEKDKKGTKRKRGAKRNVKRALEETSPDKQRKKKKEDLKGEAKEGLRDPAKANKEVSDEGDSIDQYDERADEEINSDDVESSELSKDKEKEEETEHEPESTKKMSDGNEDFESEQNSPTVRMVYHEASKTVPSSPKKVDIDDESKLPSEDDVDFLKDTKGTSMVSATSKKVMQSSKKKIDTDGKSSVSSKRTAGLTKKTSSKTKNDKADNSKKKVSMKVEAKSNRSKKDDEKKGKSSTRTGSEDTKGSKKQSTRAKSSTVGNNQAKEKNVSVEPSAEQLSAVVGEILKQVDFNVATLADIIRQLGARFDMDLMHRKTEIKQILEEVINNMTDEEDADGDDRVAEEGEKN